MGGGWCRSCRPGLPPGEDGPAAPPPPQRSSKPRPRAGLRRDVRRVWFLRHLSGAAGLALFRIFDPRARERFMRATLNKQQADVVTPRALERRALHEFDDGRLVLEHLGGDPQAFGTLVDRYQTRLLNFINRTIGDRERAEDLVQEVFIRVFRHLHRFDQTKKFSTWIYTIASNLAKNELRNRSRNPLVLFQTIKKHWEADHRPLQFEDTTARPDDLYRKRYLKEAVDQCVGQLPPTTAPSSCCASSRGRATPRSPTSPVATWAR